MFLVFLIFCFFFIVFFTLNFFFSSKVASFSKLSSFECGFDSLGLVQISFSIHFFMITLVFVLFDLELVLLLGFIFMDFNSIFFFFVLFFFVLSTFYLELYFKKLLWVV